MENLKKSHIKIANRLQNSIIGNIGMLLVFSFLMTANISAQKIANADTIKIKTSAQCGMCKVRIEAALAYEKGIKSSNLNIDSKIIEVVYDNKKTDAAKIKTAINKTGYDADETKADADAYAKLPNCCKKKTCSPGCSGHHHK